MNAACCAASPPFDRELGEHMGVGPQPRGSASKRPEPESNRMIVSLISENCSARRGNGPTCGA